MRFEMAGHNVLITLTVRGNARLLRRPTGVKHPFSLSSAPTRLWRFLRRFKPEAYIGGACAADYKLRTTWNAQVPGNVRDYNGPVVDLKITRRYPLTAAQRDQWVSPSHLAESTALKHN